MWLYAAVLGMWEVEPMWGSGFCGVGMWEVEPMMYVDGRRGALLSPGLRVDKFFYFLLAVAGKLHV